MIRNIYAEMKATREEYGYSHEDLASKLKTSAAHVVNIEAGLVDIREESELQSQIYRFVEKKLDVKLEVIFDYLNITFRHSDISILFNDILKIDKNRMEYVVSGRNNYEGYYFLEGIEVYCSTAGSMQGSMISMKGTGCRRFEGFLEEQGRTWQEYIVTAFEFGGRASRLDLAINDYERMLSIPRLREKQQNDELETPFESFLYDDSETRKKSTGKTYYLGSRSSKIYFCFYEKDAEQAKKLKVQRETIPVKNRYELRLGKENANNVLYAIYGGETVESITFNIFNTYLRFLTPNESLLKKDWSTYKPWADFIGNAETMKLATEPSKSTYEKTLNWLRVYCSSAIYAVKMLDRLNGTTFLVDMLSVAENDLPDKYRMMIEDSIISDELRNAFVTERKRRLLMLEGEKIDTESL